MIIENFECKIWILNNFVNKIRGESRDLMTLILFI
jgi:hypothetical protein